MVSQQSTQYGNTSHSNDWTMSGDDSVRITAQDEGRIIAKFLGNALPVQRAVTESERIDRESNGAGAKLYTQADLKVSNAAAIQQWIASNLAAFGGEENRDFLAVAK